MAKQLSWRLVERTLRLSGLMLFTPQDLRHLLNASEVSIRFLLTRAHKRGDVAKLRRGLYSLDYQTPSELAIANALLRPSYVSLYYAMAYYNLIPEAPTSLPPKLEFDGVEDLECGEPMLDNDVFGYCKIPCTNQYYIWIPCVEACPDSPYYTTLVKRVDESTVVEEFRTLAKEWDAAKATQDDFMFTGVGAGLGELIIGGLTFGAACLVGTTFTFGTSCAVWFATAGLGGGVVWYSASRSIEEGNTMTSKQNAAQERYDEIPEATPRPPAP